MAYVNAGRRLASINDKVRECAHKEKVLQLQHAANERLVTVSEKMGEWGQSLKPWICCGGERHRGGGGGGQYQTLEKVSSLSRCLSIYLFASLVWN